MTDGSHRTDGYPLDELSEFSETAEREFGGVVARPSWPGVARPAGWFLSAPEEAAPSGVPGTEPARPDNQDSAPAPADHVDLEERPTVTPWQPPVVGPTEALRGRAGGPGFVVPAGLVPGIHDPQNRSGWQVAHSLWQESGIDWDMAQPVSPLSAPTLFPAFDPEPADLDPDADPDPDPSATYVAPDELPRRRSRPQQPEESAPWRQGAAPERNGWPQRSDELDQERTDDPAWVQPFEQSQPSELPQSLEQSRPSEQSLPFERAPDPWGWPASPGPVVHAGRAWEQPGEAPGEQPQSFEQAQDDPDDWAWEDSSDPHGRVMRPWEQPDEQPRPAGQFDSGHFDAGQFDSGQFDAGQFDSGQVDTSQVEAGPFAPQQPPWRLPEDPGYGQGQRSARQSWTRPDMPQLEPPQFEAPQLEAPQFEAPHVQPSQFEARPPSRSWQQAQPQADGQPRPRPWLAPDGQQPRTWHPSGERPAEYYGPDQQRFQPAYQRQGQLTTGRAAPARLAPGQPTPDQEPSEHQPWRGRPLDVRQPWEGEQHRPAPRGGRRPRRVWQAARVGVPVVLIVAVGGGALVLLTGRAHEMLSSTGWQGSATTAPAGNGSTAAAASAVFPGYPGLRGSVQITSIATDGAVLLAVGSADDHAALWRRDGSGSWTLLRNRPGLPQGTILTGIAHGPAGWLAVGNLSTTGQPSTASVASTGQQPVVLTSADGVTWHSAIGNAAFAGPGFTVNAVAAASTGYVVVGEQMVNGVPVDAMWFTPDLARWTRGGDTIASTVSSLSSGMSDSKIFAVAPTATGFVAVGTHNGCHTAWVTTDGLHWRSYDIPKPTGSQDPLLNHVAVVGSTVVASGDLGTHGGRIPLIVASTDGGVHWQATEIGSYGAFSGPQGTVTALSADGSGFIAAGLVSAPGGGQRAVTWTSANGLTWSAATPATQGTRQITALTSAGSPGASIASVTAQAGTTSVEVTAPAS